MKITISGVSRQLAQSYVDGDWLQRIDQGAYIKSGGTVDWSGGLYALQYQLNLQIHAGALTALELQGFGQYVALGSGAAICLYKSVDETKSLPLWFKRYFGKQHPVHCLSHNLFENDQQLGLLSKQIQAYSVLTSSPERAMMEYLDLVPRYGSFEYANTLMEKLRTLRPQLVQELLENCTSVKVKRLFLYLADSQNHLWFKKLNIKRIDLGKGKRVIGTGGKFNRKYQLSLPEIKAAE